MLRYISQMQHGLYNIVTNVYQKHIIEVRAKTNKSFFNLI